jgi:hypothetical protein
MRATRIRSTTGYRQPGNRFDIPDEYENVERGEDGEAMYIDGVGLWCPSCVVSINIPVARARYREKIKCRVCNEIYDNPLCYK